MYCQHCGKQISNSSKFCGNCGNPTNHTVNSKTTQPADVLAEANNLSSEIKKENLKPKFKIWQFLNSNLSIRKGGASFPNQNKIDFMNKSKKITDTGSGLIDDSKPPMQLMQIRCDNCDYVGKPKEWDFRFWIGILYLISVLSVLGVVFYFLYTNPYICRNCAERNKLVKILNNRKTIPIKSSSKKSFTATAIGLLIVGIILSIIRVVSSSLK